MILDTSKNLILDADVVYHFTIAGKIEDIDKIFTNKLVISDTVLRELSNKTMYHGIGPLVRTRRVQLIRTSKDYDLIAVYRSLNRYHGKGESMSMAYCKVYKESLASSNIKDIQLYCEANQIQYVTTLDFIHQAYKIGLWTVEESDAIIKFLKDKGERIPRDVNSLSDYQPRISGFK